MHRFFEVKSFEVDSSHMPLSSEVESIVTKSTAVDLGSISASSRVMFLYRSDLSLIHI